MRTCPSCNTPRADEQPAPADKGRRITRFHVCKQCGALIRMSTREGWERWYDLDWSGSASDKLVNHCAERAEFYERLGRPQPPDGLCGYPKVER